MWLALAACLACTPSSRTRLAPVVEDILASWRTADLVCLGEEHGSRAAADLRLALIADPRFAERVDVVLLEAASPLHQDLLDRFVVDGEELDRDALRPIWLDAGLGEFWESPVYEGLLRALQRMNLRLPPGRRLRVIAGAAPVDWSRVTSGAELAPYLDRRDFFARLATAAVLEPGRKGLAVYGAAHCEKSGMGFPGALPAALRRRVRSILPLAATPAAAAGIARLALGAEPRLLPVAGRPWATAPASDFGFPAGERTLEELVDGLAWQGEAADQILAPRPGELPPQWRRELDRRARLWRQARELTAASPG